MTLENLNILDEIDKQIAKGRATVVDTCRYQTGGGISNDLAKSIVEDLPAGVKGEVKVALLGGQISTLAKAFVTGAKAGRLR
jgi:hypothetical protein